MVTLNHELQDKKGIYFLILNLTDGKGNSISHNVYWMSRGNDFNALKTMPSAAIQTKLLKTETKANDNHWTYEFSNPSKQVAFFINPQLWNDQEEIMPTFWTSNYFSLAPGEKIIITASCPRVLSLKKPVLRLEAWNVPVQ